MLMPTGYNKKNINQGMGKVFMTPANTDFAETSLYHAGVLSDDGVSTEIVEERFKHESGGFQVADPELIKTEIKIKFSLLAATAANFKKLIGFGEIETDEAVTSEAFTEQPIILYNNDWNALPFPNIKTITAVKDTAATPNEYEASDLEIKGTAGDNDGYIRIPTTSSIPTDEDGVTLLVSGTRSKRETYSIKADPDKMTQDYYGMRVVKRNKQGNWHYFDIERVTADGSPTISWKNGEAYKYDCSFTGVMTPAQTELYTAFFEKA